MSGRLSKTDTSYISLSPAKKTDTYDDALGSRLIKALAVYLITAGSIGWFFSALSIEADQTALNASTALFSFIFMLPYRKHNTAQAFPLLFFFSLAGISYLLREYLDAGFNGIIYQIRNLLVNYFEIKDVKIADRSTLLTAPGMTLLTIIWAAVLAFFLTENIQKRAGTLLPTVLSVLAIIPAIYLGLTPDIPYTFMAPAGLFMIFVFRSSGHFRISYSDTGYDTTRKGFAYSSDSKILIQTALIPSIVIALSVTAAVHAVPKPDTAKNAVREKTDDIIRDVLILGPAGLLNRYSATGGISNGKIGGIASIRYDGKTDLKVTFTPYTDETIYLKAHTYDIYKSYASTWTSTKDSDINQLSGETSSLKKSYLSGDKKTARGIMTVKNTGAGTAPYVPYYSDTGTAPREIGRGETATYTYFPYFDAEHSMPDRSGVTTACLDIPEDDIPAIRKICREAGLSKGMSADKISKKLKSYFQKKYPYSLSPGATPESEDFVKYFLETNKKGYCTHFASASILIFRYLGIPARYCEGYVIPFMTYANSTPLTAEGSSGYYDGYNSLGDDMNAAQVNVPDSSAHAWTEIYTDDHGWSVADMTPSVSSGNSDGVTGISDDDESDDTDTTKRVSSSRILRILKHFYDTQTHKGLLHLLSNIICAGLIVTILLLRNRIKGYISLLIKYRKSGPDNRLILLYGRYTDKARKRDPAFCTCINYESQLVYLFPSMPNSEMSYLKELLDRAAFSRNSITEDEQGKARALMKKYRKKAPDSKMRTGE